MGERPSSRVELAAWYARALEVQASSGLSVTEFAEEIGVTPTTLYQWRRRLCDSAGGDRSQAKLVEVLLATTKADSAAKALVVRVPGGRSIDVPQGFDDGDLRRLLAVLESC
jgi:transposase-like protein